jgi:CRISPR type III-associated protein (TIGR04423 family)
MIKIEINDIDFDLQYEGYLWYSNAQAPVYIDLSRPIKREDFTEIPFIVEGYLYCSSAKAASIKIKSIDGIYQIYTANLKGLAPEQCSRVEFVIKNDSRKLKALQYWNSVEDESCEGMSVLKPSWIAFEGFQSSNSTES